VALVLSKENVASRLPLEPLLFRTLFHQTLLEYFPTCYAEPARTLQFSIILIIKRVQLQFYTAVNANG